MSDANNPYNPPDSDVNNNLQARSSIPKVIGIISIILGTLGLLFGLFGLVGMIFASGAIEALQQEAGSAGMPGLSKGYMIGSTILSILTSIWAIYIGFKLLKYLDIGRRHFNYYTILTIVVSIATFFYTKSMMDEMFTGMDQDVASAAGGMAAMTSMGAFIAPIILIIVALLLNQKSVRANLT